MEGTVEFPCGHSTKRSKMYDEFLVADCASYCDSPLQAHDDKAAGEKIAENPLIIAHSIDSI